MAIVEITGVLIDGIVTAVPKNRIDNLNDPNIEKEQGEKILKTTGIRYRRLASDTTTTSDLCYIAAVNLLEQFQTRATDLGSAAPAAAGRPTRPVLNEPTDTTPNHSPR